MARAKHDEVEAMRQVSAALDPLASDERGRVLRWAAERFALPLAAAGDGRHESRQQPAKQAPGEAPQDPGEFYAQAAPETEPDRALVVARSEERRVGKECRSRWSP